LRPCPSHLSPVHVISSDYFRFSSFISLARSAENDSSTKTEGPIRPWSSLLIRDYRLLWIASVLSSLAGQIRNVATLYQVYDISGSAFKLGLTGFLETLPFIVFGLFAGAVADAFDRKRLLVATISLQMVPNLILQPIVENALRHGVAKQTYSGHIAIRARRQNGRLIMKVEDNGPGLNASSNGLGIGLSNTRARLEQFYGNDFSFQIANSAERGATVTLDVPAFVEFAGE